MVLLIIIIYLQHVIQKYTPTFLYNNLFTQLTWLPVAFLHMATSRTGCSPWLLAGIPGFHRTCASSDFRHHRHFQACCCRRHLCRGWPEPAVLLHRLACGGSWCCSRRRRRLPCRRQSCCCQSCCRHPYLPYRNRFRRRHLCQRVCCRLLRRLRRRRWGLFPRFV